VGVEAFGFIKCVCTENARANCSFSTYSVW